MATFKVGQRVRLVYDKTFRYLHMIGSEGTIVPHCGRPTQEGIYYDYNAAFDGRDGFFHVDSDEIEPVQDDRNTVVSWESIPNGKPKIEEPEPA